MTTAGGFARLDQRVARVAQTRPRAAAILAPGFTPITYAVLHEDIVATGGALADMGLAGRTRIALLLPDGPGLLHAAITVSASAQAVPVTGTLPARDFESLLRRTDCAAVLCAEPPRGMKVLGRLEAPYGTHQVCAPAGARNGTSRPRDVPRPPGPDDVAVILTSSGTTGRPKLIPRTHRNLAAMDHTLCVHYGITEDDVGLVCMPLHHSHGLLATACPVLRMGGAAVCLDGGFSVDAFYRALAATRPTFFSAGPTHLRAVLDRGRGGGVGAGSDRLRFIRAASDFVPDDLREALEALFQVPVMPSFGLTETGHIATRDSSQCRGHPQLVGRLVVDDVAVIDEAGRELPAGEIGEIAVSGPSVSPGYIDDAPLEAAAFVDGRFRTGDTGWIDEARNLYFVERRKDLINRGGVKISPTEVEGVLRGLPGIAEVAVFPCPHTTLGEEVAAAIVPAPGACVDEAGIRARLDGRLDRASWPRRWLVVDAIPRNELGKWPRRQLAVLLGMDTAGGGAGPAHHGSPVWAWTPGEAQMARLWARVLGHERFRDSDEFLQVGGDSLRAVELLALLDAELGVMLDGRHLEGPASTVPGMARALGRSRGDGSTPSQAVPAMHLDTEAVAPRAALADGKDLLTAATMLCLAPVAALAPERARRGLCRGLALLHVALRGHRAGVLEPAVAELGIGGDARALERRVLACVYEELVVTLRAQLPAPPAPGGRVHGEEHLAAARAAAGGAVLWLQPLSGGGLAQRQLLAAAGAAPVILRSEIHPYSDTRFGRRVLNRVRTRIEDRYQAGTVVLGDGGAVQATAALAAHLRAGRFVGIAANGASGETTQVGFMGGRLRLALGAPTLAILMRRPLLPVFGARDASGRLELFVHDALVPPATGGLETRAKAMVHDFAERLAVHLRRDPALWAGWFMANTWTP